MGSGLDSLPRELAERALKSYTECKHGLDIDYCASCEYEYAKELPAKVEAVIREAIEKTLQRSSEIGIEQARKELSRSLKPTKSGMEVRK